MFRVFLLMLAASPLVAQLTALPKNIPGTVYQPHLETQLTKSVKPVYPQASIDRWEQGTVVLDAVVGTNGEIEMLGCDDYCKAQPAPMVQAAAAAVRQWHWNPVMIKGKPARIRTKLSIPFVLDEHSPAVNVCRLIGDPKTYVGKNMNVVGTAKRDHGIKVLTSPECDGAITLEDESVLTPPQKDAKYAAMQQAVAAGTGTVTVRGLVRDENRPGAYPGYRIIVDRVLKVTSN